MHYGKVVPRMWCFSPNLVRSLMERAVIHMAPVTLMS